MDVIAVVCSGYCFNTDRLSPAQYSLTCAELWPKTLLISSSQHNMAPISFEHLGAEMAPKLAYFVLERKICKVVRVYVSVSGVGFLKFMQYDIAGLGNQWVIMGYWLSVLASKFYVTCSLLYRLSSGIRYHLFGAE